MYSSLCFFVPLLEAEVILDLSQTSDTSPGHYGHSKSGIAVMSTSSLSKPSDTWTSVPSVCSNAL